MIWEAVVSYVKNGQRYRHIVRVKANSREDASIKITAEYGTGSISSPPRLIPEN
jgi:hypothetical protein